MKFYHLTRTQFLPITLKEAWDFFSTPENLSKITPPHMNFRILFRSGGEKMYPGQIIKYKVDVLRGVTVQWVTEISHVVEPTLFVDEQRSGPYAIWHHQHHFNEVEGGVKMTDELTFALPFGWLGRLVHWLLVGREVNAIFEFRNKVLEQMFDRHSSQAKVK
ncbi:MAG: SRPBCC family protein [Bacteroidetes bacterium]|nr:SRPBCC family protein [Bacteroidota bacterium]